MILYRINNENKELPMRPADPAKFNTIKARGLFDSSVISARYVLVIPTLLYKASIRESLHDERFNLDVDLIDVPVEQTMNKSRSHSPIITSTKTERQL
jgi:hypothetical protein